jgi:hypothetical protein
MVIEILFFSLLAACAFSLRGIWGHQIGGAIMGTLMGLALSIIYHLPLYLGLTLTFALAIGWSFSSFAGWANLKGLKRFLCGYIIYGLLPNVLIATLIFQFPTSMTDAVPHIVLILFGSLGMGIGFSISSPLIEKYKNRTGFNSWKYFMEYLSGFLYGLTTIVTLTIFQDHILDLYILIIPDYEIQYYIFAVLSFAFIPTLSLLLSYRYYIDPRKFNRENTDFIWSARKKQIIFSSTIFIGVIIAIIIIVDLVILTYIPLFVILIWFYIISGRLIQDKFTRSFYIDLFFDCLIGVILTILIYIV